MKIVPIESIGFAIASGNSYVSKRCAEGIVAASLSTSSLLLRNALESTPHHSLLVEYNSREGSCVISDLNLEHLYPIVNSLKGFQSPIETLQEGRDRLHSLVTDPSFSSMGSQESLASPKALKPGRLKSFCSYELGIDEENMSLCSQANTQILNIVNLIRNKHLAVCINMIVGFINQPVIDIPLQKECSGLAIHRGQFTLCVHELGSLNMDHIRKILSDNPGKQVCVRVADFMKGSEFARDTDIATVADKSYAGKLHFLAQSLHDTVTSHTQWVSYSLEHQLVNSLQVEKIVSKSMELEDILQDWDILFDGSILKKVAESYRPLIARWLLWSLMVHNLREKLAKYMAVGVVGLVNSGKSCLVNTLFGIEVEKIKITM